MAWDTDSTLIFNPQFKGARNRLLLSYLGVMVGILATAGFLVYKVVEKTIYDEFGDRMEQLTTAAVLTMDLVIHEVEEIEEHHEKYHAHELPLTETNGTIIPLTFRQLIEKNQANSVLELPPTTLISHGYGVEWFDTNYRRLIQEGNLFPTASISDTAQANDIVIESGHIYIFTRPIYQETEEGDRGETPIGYIRASKSMKPLQAELRRLRWGLVFGSFMAFLLATVAGIWLTQLSLKPAVKSFNQLKQFTADASHELRSPLTAIRTTISVLQSHPERIDAQDEKKFSAISSASEQMQEMIEDLLLLARLDGQPIQSMSQWREIPLDEMLEDLIELAELKAVAKEITLKIHALPKVNMLGDSGQLMRLFSNLLDNAIYYTDRAGTVTVEMQKVTGGVTIAFEDTGIGIDPEQIPYIFERFWRSDRARSVRKRGTGLGLAIAQSIVRFHGGNITVTSQPGVGSCFQVKLPGF